MSVAAVIGFRMVKIYSLFTGPALFLFLVFLALRKQDGIEPTAVVEFSLAGVVQAVSMFANAMVVGALVVSDLAQFAESRRQAQAGVIAAFLIGVPVVLMLMCLIVTREPSGNLAQVLMGAGLAGVVIPLSLLSTWDVNDTNLFSASLAASAIFKNVSRRLLAMIAAGFGIAGGVSGIFDGLLGFLGILGILIPPAADVLIAHEFFRQRPTKAAGFCYLSGVGLALVTTPLDSNGLGFMKVTTLPALDGVILAFILSTLRGRGNPSNV
jgi:cytosine permease